MKVLICASPNFGRGLIALAFISVGEPDYPSLCFTLRNKQNDVVLTLSVQNNTKTMYDIS